MSPNADAEDILRGYVPPTQDEVRDWWQTADIAIDTNVLLNLYRYSLETREELLEVLDSLGERLWIPRRVAEEFARNRATVLRAQLSAQDKITALFDSYINDIPASLRTINSDLGRRTGAPDHHLQAIDALSDLRDRLLHDERQRFGDAATMRTDPLLDEVREMLGERLGAGLEEAELEAAMKDGVDRFRRRVPPGWRDAKDKEGDDAFGDLLVWTEILKRAKHSRRPVIFVTDDAKDDWMLKVGGHTIGPQPALVRELWDAAQVPLLVYGTARFVKRATQELGLKEQVSDEALAEFRDLAFVPSTARLLNLDAPRTAVTEFLAAFSDAGPKGIASVVSPDHVFLGLLGMSTESMLTCAVRGPSGRISVATPSRGDVLYALFPAHFAPQPFQESGTHIVTWFTQDTERQVVAETTFTL